MRLGGYFFPRTIHSLRLTSTRLDALLHPDLRVSGGNGVCQIDQIGTSKAEVKSQIDLSERFLIEMLVLQMHGFART